ncbi:ATP-binding protein [Dankookia sp. P2]|uniref:PAS domain-containing sensor histidine kinase n=1 Tax=Dankookia sp. P2 TaxID=3423955 RepID=UPI003D66A386
MPAPSRCCSAWPRWAGPPGGRPRGRGGTSAAALRAGRAEIERLLRNLPAVVFLRSVAADGESRLLYRGGDTAAVFGWPAERIAASPDMTELAAPGTTPLVPFLRRVVAEGSASSEWRLRQPDGSWRWMRTTARVLSHRPEGGAEVVGCILDIHVERAAAARAAASGRLTALGEMAAGLAHELKQPLAIISLAAENAARALRAENQAARSAGSTGLPPRRPGRGADRAPAPLRPRRRGGGDAGSDAAAPGAGRRAGAGRRLLRDAHVTLEVALGPPPGPLVMAQLVPLEQVLANLIGNARDAFADHPPGAPRRLRITADQAAGRVRITLADTAGGIPQAVLDRLFEPFVTTKDAERGTGLGLSICHGLVRGMGGTIEARNDADGAVFTITLAAAPDPTEAPAEAGSLRLSASRMWVPSISSTTAPSAVRRPV